MSSADVVPRSRWVHYAAALWAAIFAAPHTWWALGSSFGFPGGRASHQLMMTSWWRYAFDVVVILLSILAAYVALALVQRSGRSTRRLRVMAWMAAALLSLRGVAGMIADGASDPVWWPTFLTGGLLFMAVGWMARSPSEQPT